MKRFDNKSVLVTGGNSGIGLVSALEFSTEGERVIISGCLEATLDQANAQLGSTAIALCNDAGDIHAAND